MGDWSILGREKGPMRETHHERGVYGGPKSSELVWCNRTRLECKIKSMVNGAWAALGGIIYVSEQGWQRCDNKAPGGPP